MNKTIESYVNKCETCIKHQRSQVKETIIHHELPANPFEKVAIDIAEHESRNCLILVDYLSKWLEIIHMRDKSFESVMTSLKQIFCAHGVPKEVVYIPFNSHKFLPKNTTSQEHL